MDAGEDRADPTGAPDDVLRVDGVTVSVGGRRILQDVSFGVRAGEVTGLIGSNGAGKTTLFRVILGLQPAEGRVLVDGRARRGRNPGIGYVPQKIALDPDIPLRARDLVALGIDGNRFGIPLPSRRRTAAVDEMLAAVDATRLADARVGTLSGGEQQRIVIAHALVSRPRLLLLDEPLANLDLPSGQEIVQLLAGVSRDHKIGVLISAHEMNPLLPVMNRVVYIAGGRAASGTTDEVVSSATLSRLYGRHIEVLRVRGRVIVVAGDDDRREAPPGPTDQWPGVSALP